MWIAPTRADRRWLAARCFAARCFAAATVAYTQRSDPDGGGGVPLRTPAASRRHGLWKFLLVAALAVTGVRWAGVPGRFGR